MALTTVDAGLLGTQAQYTGFKNRIINGAMVISQRGTSFTPADADYTLDRWQAKLTASSKYTVAQSSTAPTGFTNSLLVTSSSAYSVGSGDAFSVRQAIEGFNTADFGWGAVGAASVTLSFWVRSSLTGTFGGSIFNASANYSYPFSYTISAANTWEQKTVTIAGPTSGTWATNNTVGAYVVFGLGVGSTYSGSAGSWSSNLYISATGATSVVGTNGATFYITGVQLEKGSTATSFDYRPYTTEQLLCYRYCQVYSASSGTYNHYAPGMASSSTNARFDLQFTGEMRSSPTFSKTGTLQADGVTYVGPLTMSLDYATTRVCRLAGTVGSGLTAGQYYALTGDQSANSSLVFSAEL